MPATPKVCPECGSPMLSGGPIGGLCPGCLLAAGRNGGEVETLPLTGEPKIRIPPVKPWEMSGDTIGPYRLLEPLGEGGMGQVFLAEQSKPIRRKVALKLIKPGMDTKEVLARFEAERQALALMDHPNIARVYEAGATDAGRPYFVMELVEGHPLTDYCDKKKLSLRERLELFTCICEAVQHAHQKGIIHRDLKPSNLLVTEIDDRHVPKVIDFGVAKALGPGLSEYTLFTLNGQIVGTPQYMSPEQATFESKDIDARSDIYSLGVILYELLAGRTPLEMETLRRVGLEAVLRTIREEEPPKPSTRLSSLNEETRSGVAAARGLALGKLSQLLRGELDWIAMKALDKDRSRRYGTASALGEDVRRYLADEPVSASPPSAGYRLGKFARRNKGRLMAGTAVALGVVAALFTWDHLRVKTAYFADFGLRWGIPEGVASLTKAQRSHRISHFAIESSRGKVRTVRRLNALGQLAEDEDNFDTAIHRVTYREDGSLQQVELRGRNDGLILRRSYGEIRESAEGPVRFVEFQQEHHDAPFAMAALGESQKTDITAQREVYQEDGRLAWRTFMNVYRQTRSNGEGVFGERLHYEGDSLLPIRIENLNAAGAPAPDRNGIVATTNLRTALGDSVESRHFGIGEKPALAANGRHRELTERDQYGNLMAWSLFDAAGKPVVSKSTFVHRKEMQRDRAGLTVEARNIGRDGQPVLDKDGVHRTTYQYDEKGNTIEFRRFDTRNKPCLFAKEGHLKTQAFDDRGNCVEWAIFGLNDEPVLDGYGVHLARRQFAQGKITENRSLGVNQEPVVSKAGYHRIVRKYDASGNVISEAYFGPEDEPLLLKPHGVHRILRRYDARGNRTAEIMFGADGQPCLSVEFGVHRIESDFDEQGNLLEQSFFGTRDEPVLLKTQGIHRIRKTYDEKGNLVSDTYFDTQGQPALSSERGIHSFRTEFDALGRAVQQRNFGMKGEPILRRDSGNHLIRNVIDERGNIISEQFFGTADEPVLAFNQNAHRVDREFNDRSLVISKATFGVDKEPVEGKDHSHRETYDWDERGNETEVRYFNADGSLALSADGYHHLARTYDERGQLIELSYLGTKGEFVLDNKTGIALQRQTFDDLGRVIELSWHGTKGEPTIRKDHFIHRVAHRYDAYGYIAESAYFDELNRPTLLSNLAHRVAYVINSQGHRLETRYFGTKGEPILDKGFGAHLLKNSYDALGREVERSLFGIEEEPVIGKNGQHYHRMVQTYDAHSRVTSIEYFAPNEAPMLRDGGDQKYHRLENTYNERGQNIGWAHFGVNGEPVLRGGENWHRISRKVDLRGKTLEERFFGVKDEPVLNRSGYHWVTFTLDSAGNQLSERFFGLNDEPTLFEEDYHHRAYERDLRGNLTEIRYFGVKGEPILSPGQTHHRSTYVNDSRGNRIESRYFGLRDEPVATKEGYHRYTQSWDERGRRIGYALFDSGDTPVLSSAGNHRSEEYYDERGREIGQAYFGIDGEPAVHQNGNNKHHRFTRAYDQRGNTTEEIFYGPNNEPAYGWSDCHKHLRTFDTRGNLLSEVRLDLDGSEMSLLDLARRWIEGFDQLEKDERNDKIGQIMGALEKSAKNTVEPGTESFSQLESLLERVEVMLPGLDPNKDDIGRLVRGLSTVRRYVAEKLLQLEEPDNSWEPWMAAAVMFPLEWEAVVPDHQQLELWQHIRAAVEAYCTWNNKRTTREGSERLLAQLVKHQPLDPRAARLRNGAEWRITERLYDFHRAAGDLEAAGQTVRRLVALTTQWVKLEPNVIEAHVNHAMALRKDAFLRWDIDKTEESLQPLKEGIKILLAIRKRFPKDPNITVQIGFFHGNLAERQRAIPSNEEAIANYTTAIKELTLGFELTKPEKPQFFADIGRYNDGIGEILLRKGDRPAAAKWFQSGADAWQRFAQGEPDHPTASLEQARQLFKVARTMEEAGSDLNAAVNALLAADEIFIAKASKGALPGAFAGLTDSISNLRKKLDAARAKAEANRGQPK